MDADTIAARCRYGYGKAATKLGRPCAVYRPIDPLSAAISQAALIGNTIAAFDTVPTFSFQNTTKFKNRIFYGLMDATLLQVGDYLVCAGLTYFVATIDDIPAPMVVRCDRSLTVSRPGAQTPGSGFYGGDLTASETPIITSWPAALLPGTKGEKGDTNLPGDVRLPWVQVLMPVTVPQILFADVLLDDLPSPYRYIVSQVVATPLGVEITATQVLV